MKEGRFSRWRLHLVFATLGVALLVPAGRAAYLQHWRGRELSDWAKRQQFQLVVLPARPGNIFGQTAGGCVLLAASKQVDSCYADPSLLEDGEVAAVMGKLAVALEEPPGELLDRFARRRDKRFVWLARDITASQAQAVGELNLRAVRVAREWRRQYPNGPLGGHVLGFRQIDGAAAAGIELGADSWLRPREGLKVVHVDAARRGRYADVAEYYPPADGKHVVLTLDVMIQGFLEQALAETVQQYGKTAAADEEKATAAMGVVMDPATGAVLAMASVPACDPNTYGLASPSQRRNRAITDPYEPGSAFKPFIAAGAVQLGRAELTTTFFCHHGIYRAHRGGTIRDFPGCRFGELPLSEILIRSSNIGMAKLGERLGNDQLHRISWAFGFGRRSGLDLPGECPGTLVPTRRWTSYATRRLPFGQGPIMITTLQLTNAFAAIANGGVLMRPRLVDRVLDADGQVIYRGSPQRIRRVLDPQVARQLIDEALVEVVQRGTGKRCRLQRWQAFGKTGTAQIGGPGGYEEREHTATFVGGAPAGRPAVVCAISVYRPEYSKGYTGGKVSAPAVGGVLAKTLAYLGVPPDDLQAASSPGGLGGM